MILEETRLNWEKLKLTVSNQFPDSESEEAAEEPLYQRTEHSIPQTEPYLERS